jgi:hypothetical protein
MPESRARSRKYALTVIVAVVILLVPLGWSLASTLVFRGLGARNVYLERPDPRHPRCVRDTSYMRYHHWELLTQVRDEVMRAGKRGIIGLIGLNKCRECHTSRKNFCNHCHDAVNLYPFCFGCHYYP